MAKARTIAGLDPQASTARNAGLILRARLAEMDAYTSAVGGPAHVKKLHNLRIATKRVRYTLEVFAEFLPAASKDFAEELAKLQDELGELHDSEVMLALLHLLLQKEITVQGSKNGEATRVAQEERLLSAEMLGTLLHTDHQHTPTEHERAGLRSFLHKQEERRTQAYASFRQHWDRLEKDQFRRKMIQMLDRSEG